MPNRNLVSIIVPAYCASKYIEETIKSVISQSYCDWEMIIIDDCSTDNTSTLVDYWCEKDIRIKIYHMPFNSGPAAARNMGIENAKGRWIAFLDSDDYWLPNKLELSLEFAKKHNAAIIFTGFRRINADGSKVGQYIPVPNTLNYKDFLGNTAIATSTVLIDTIKHQEIRMKSVYYDDFVCFLEILKKGFIAYGLDEDLMRYRIINGSISRNKLRSALEVWNVYRNIENLSLSLSIWSFINYAVRALIKYSKL